MVLVHVLKLGGNPETYDALVTIIILLLLFVASEVASIECGGRLRDA